MELKIASRYVPFDRLRVTSLSKVVMNMLD